MHRSLSPSLSKSLSDHLKFAGEVLGLALGAALPSVGFFKKLNTCLIQGKKKKHNKPDSTCLWVFFFYFG